jgi:DNA-nicking Smr family endonuclease
MLHAIGTKVRLRATGDIGRIEAFLGDGMISVRLEDGDLIPVFPEALLPADTDPAADSSVKARRVPGKREEKRFPVVTDTGDSQYLILNPWGVMLAFEPVLRNDATAERYRVFVVSDLAQPLVFGCIFRVDDSVVWERLGDFPGPAFKEMGEMLFDELNHRVVFRLEVREKRPTGTGPALIKEVKIKAKQFFRESTQRTAPLLNRRVHLYKVFPTLDPAPAAKKPKPAVDLVRYTEQQRKSRGAAPRRQLRQLPHEVEELAAFDTTIDLHIEKLVDDPAGLARNQILPTQLLYFESYLDKAVRLGVDRIFIIHGVGAGKLRAAVAKVLADHPYVKEFKNEYHHRFKFGATEAILG